MRRDQKRVLIALNAALLGVLAVVTLGPAASGQPGQRARGAYTLVGGEIQGGNTNAVYIVDSANQELVALRWNSSTKRMVGIGYRSLAADADGRGGR